MVTFRHHWCLKRFYYDLEGPKVEEWRCNTCIATTSGPAELGRLLLELWKKTAESHIDALEDELKYGWHYIHCLELENNKFSWAEVYKKSLAQRGVENIGVEEAMEILTPNEIKTLSSKEGRRYYKVWKRHLDETGTSFLGFLVRNSWYCQWSADYELMVQRIEFLKACTEKVEADLEILVRHALEDSSR